MQLDVPVATVPTQAPWKERLGNSRGKIAVKTLEAATQLRESPVEMDKQEAQRQRRKKRALALHPKRVIGQADLDALCSFKVRAWLRVHPDILCVHSDALCAHFQIHVQTRDAKREKIARSLSRSDSGSSSPKCHSDQLGAS